MSNVSNEWLLEKGSAYSLGENWIGSEVYADVGGEMAEICSIHLVMTRKEHLNLRKIEDNYNDNLEKVVYKSKKKWWQRAAAAVKNEDDWRSVHKAYMEARKQLYKRPTELLHKYRGIILAAQSAVELLESYKSTGRMDEDKLNRVLDIARNKIAPVFQYTGRLCSCGHKDSEHDKKRPEYSWSRRGGKCQVDGCGCEQFAYATDVIGEVSTIDLSDPKYQRNNDEDEE